MPVGIRISLNEALYLRDPQETKLGQKIIHHSIMLLDEIGYEAFTFKKLATRMSSTEASIYRYFENKHLLLTYLVCWYWEWVSFSIDIHTMNVSDPIRKLEIAIETLVNSSKDNPSIDYVNESVLHKIVINEGSKAYHTKEVDEKNTEGVYLDYKALVKNIGDIIKAINPDFPYPHALGSNLFEMANNHIYFALHLPRLTEVKIEGDDYSEVIDLMKYFAFNLIGIPWDKSGQRIHCNGNGNGNGN
jgi:hypothetical protein